MNVSKEFYFDDLIKDNILSFFPPKNSFFKKGVFYSKMCFYDEETEKIEAEHYKVMITKITKHYIYMNIEYQPDIPSFNLKKKKKKDEKGEYIFYNYKNRYKRDEQFLAINTEFFHKSDVFRPAFLEQ